MGNVKNIDIELMLEFLKAEFPKKRVKLNPRDRRFTQGIVIPSSYTNDFPVAFPMKTPSDLLKVKKILTPILQRFFGFRDEFIDIVLNSYLRII